MPQTRILFYAESDQVCPILEWLDALPPKARDKCVVRLERLAAMGNQLRRPEADYLRDGIFELRVGLQGIHYRVLYFFYGRNVAVVSHGIVKEAAVPVREIELALRRKRMFEQDPPSYTYRESP
jgi:phage-related protein